MARAADRDPRNVDGAWCVDTRCIDCDVSRHHAPGLIEAAPDGQSIVVRQPANADEELLLWRAALACPTRSVGRLDKAPAPAGVFPWEVTAGVFLCGHNDRRSFGAHSWFVPRPDGGLLVDAPHWDRELIESIGARGGLAHVLLTHRDDVADAQRYAEHFGARVWIHHADRGAAPFATDVIPHDDPTEIAPGVIAFPVPGHTRGSVLYVVDDEHLFAGDTLAWFHREQDLGAFKGATWYSWDALRDSLARFAASPRRFAWILPGHGKWHGTTRDDMHQRLLGLVARM
jgi:glyoxylase-like metal-dependent hydrolase (beta-lactamase superfamily II)